MASVAELNGSTEGCELICVSIILLLGLQREDDKLDACMSFMSHSWMCAGNGNKFSNLTARYPLHASKNIHPELCLVA